MQVARQRAMGVSAARMAALYARKMARARRFYTAQRAIGRLARTPTHRFARAGKTIWAAWRAYKRYKSKIGDPPGRSKSSRTEVTDENNYSTRALHSIETIVLNRNTLTAQDIRNRTRDTAIIKGIKICVQFRNFESHPLYCNYAVIHPKTSLGAGNQVPVTEWFRSYGEDRAVDFNPATMNPNDFHCLPINTDRYVVIRHARFRLGPSGAMSTGANWLPIKEMDMYIKLNRQIRWEGDSATDLREGQIYAVWWFDGPDSIAGTVPVASACRVLQRFVIYFKNPV